MRHLILSFCFLLILACNKKVETKKSNTNDSIVVHNEDEMYKAQNGKIKVIDTTVLMNKNVLLMILKTAKLCTISL